VKFFRECLRKTLGTPIAILVRNKDTRPQDYDEMAETYRPSHADATYDAKYGIRNWQGGGRSSARETIDEWQRVRSPKDSQTNC
jgi:chorismate synthase